MGEQLYKLLVDQEFKCALSGRPLTVESAEIDHRVAMQDGGAENIENLQWVEASINRAKGTMGNAAFIEMCIAVARWHERQEHGGSEHPSGS